MDYSAVREEESVKTLPPVVEKAEEARGKKLKILLLLTDPAQSSHYSSPGV